jgi:hypothetical protein
MTAVHTPWYPPFRLPQGWGARRFVTHPRFVKRTGWLSDEPGRTTGDLVGGVDVTDSTPTRATEEKNLPAEPAKVLDWQH